MSKANTLAKELMLEAENAEVISIKKGKLLKLQHDIKNLRKQFKKETEEFLELNEETSETTKSFIGELNGTNEQEGGKI